LNYSQTEPRSVPDDILPIRTGALIGLMDLIYLWFLINISSIDIVCLSAFVIDILWFADIGILAFLIVRA